MCPEIFVRWQKSTNLFIDTVLHDSHDEDYIRMQVVDYPSPMYGLAVSAKNRGDEQKISDALQKLHIEDPCFRVEHNSGTNETVIKGLGDLQMRVFAGENAGTLQRRG